MPIDGPVILPATTTAASSPADSEAKMLEFTGVPTLVDSGTLLANLTDKTVYLKTAVAEYTKLPGLGSTDLHPSNTIASWTANQLTAAASGGAQITVSSDVPVAAYDAAGTETCLGYASCPTGAYLGGDVIVDLYWTSASATSGATRWSLSLQSIDSGVAVGGTDWTTAVTNNATAPGTAGLIVKTQITLNSAGKAILARDGAFRLRVQRIGGDGADTMTGDAHLFMVKIRSVL